MQAAPNSVSEAMKVELHNENVTGSFMEHCEELDVTNSNLTLSNNHIPSSPPVQLIGNGSDLAINNPSTSLTVVSEVNPEQSEGLLPAFNFYCHELVFIVL